ncbi:hypothetical protein PHMEG_00035111 [Phytophthora megakarya]|uniref:Uncharacterized protein n=1 Tax=Phytophthora megakarya TaxID=4795 RepID=A0A225UPN4_9STRA|nr:hypothetical protein PHMEG_00035111 [Phytophthora megakarya]
MWRSRIKVLVFFPREMFEDEFYAAVPSILNFMYKGVVNTDSVVIGSPSVLTWMFAAILAVNG